MKLRGRGRHCRVGINRSETCVDNEALKIYLWISEASLRMPTVMAARPLSSPRLLSSLTSWTAPRPSQSQTQATFIWSSDLTERTDLPIKHSVNGLSQAIQYISASTFPPLGPNLDPPHRSIAVQSYVTDNTRRLQPTITRRKRRQRWRWRWLPRRRNRSSRRP